jgi:hypothetical protein
MTGSSRVCNLGAGTVEVSTYPHSAQVERKSGVSDQDWNALCETAKNAGLANTKVETGRRFINASPENIMQSDEFDCFGLETALLPSLGQSFEPERSR